MRQFKALNDWFRTPLGLLISKEFAQVLKPLSFLQGETLLQLGHCHANPWLTYLRYKHQWIASPLKTGGQQLECSLNQLPFSRNSLNCILAPLALEPFGSSLNLLDEMDRVLKPMGHLIFMSINPWSLWGLALKTGLLNCYDGGKIKMRTPYYWKRALAQRGYKQVTLINFCYLPPVNNQKILHQLSFFNEVGKMLWPFPADLYCYIAQKYEYIHPNLLAHDLKAMPNDYKSPLQPAINEILKPLRNHQYREFQ